MFVLWFIIFPSLNRFENLIFSLLLIKLIISSFLFSFSLKVFLLKKILNPLQVSCFEFSEFNGALTL